MFVQRLSPRGLPLRRHELFRNLSKTSALLVAASLLVSAHPALAHEFKAGAIEIDHPWARATPPGAKVGGGYLTLKNEGGSDDQLVSATADIAGRVEIHQMAVKDGVMSMRALPEGVAVPAGATVKLGPGGVHIMFLDLKKPLVKGQSVHGTLTFAKSGTVEVSYAVEAIGAKAPDGQGADGHGVMPGMDAGH